MKKIFLAAAFLAAALMLSGCQSKNEESGTIEYRTGPAPRAEEENSTEESDAAETMENTVETETVN